VGLVAAAAASPRLAAARQEGGAPAAVPAKAQEPAPAADASAAALPAMRFAGVTVKEAARRIQQAAGVAVVADRTVANLPLTLDLPGGVPLERALERVVAALPAGVAVKKVFLPPAVPAAAPGVVSWDGDRVAALVMAQEGLFSPAKKTTAAEGTGVAAAGGGSVTVLGKPLSGDTAATVVAALELRPVYLLTNPAVANDPVQKMNAAQIEGLQNYLAMTPEQQTAFANQQLENLFNMDPALRQQLFAQQRQMMQGFMQRLQSLPDEQRAQFWRDLTGGAWDGRGAPPRALGGAGAAAAGAGGEGGEGQP
jgi:hypothetical protein